MGSDFRRRTRAAPHESRAACILWHGSRRCASLLNGLMPAGAWSRPRNREGASLCLFGCGVRRAARGAPRVSVSVGVDVVVFHRARADAWKRVYRMRCMYAQCVCLLHPTLRPSSSSISKGRLPLGLACTCLLHRTHRRSRPRSHQANPCLRACGCCYASAEPSDHAGTGSEPRETRSARGCRVLFSTSSCSPWSLQHRMAARGVGRPRPV